MTRSPPCRAAQLAGGDGRRANKRVFAIAQFSMYVMFPIGIMYYFGTNLDNRFSVEGFWPRPDQCNTVPRDREELKIEYEKMVARAKLKQAQQQENSDAQNKS